MMYHNPQAVVQVQVNGRRSRAFTIERLVQQGCPLSPLLYVLALEPLLCRLRDEGTNLALRSLMIPQSLYPAAWIKRRLVSTSRLQESRSILTKMKVCCLVLGVVAILFQGPSAAVTDLSGSLGCGSGLTSNWSEIGRKYKLR